VTKKNVSWCRGLLIADPNLEFEIGSSLDQIQTVISLTEALGKLGGC
jgi:hypothetical protein